MNCKEFFLLEIEYVTFPGRDTGGVTEGALKKKINRLQVQIM